MRGITPEESLVLIGGGFAHTGLESFWGVVAGGVDPVGGRAGGVTNGVAVGGTFLRIPISAEPVFVEPVLDTGIFISVEVLLLGSHP